MLSNFKTWFQNTPGSMMDEKSSLENIGTSIKQNSSNQSYSISTTNLNDFACKLNLSRNLNHSTSALLTKNHLVKRNITLINENGRVENIQHNKSGTNFFS